MFIDEIRRRPMRTFPNVSPATALTVTEHILDAVGGYEVPAIAAYNVFDYISSLAMERPGSLMVHEDVPLFATPAFDTMWLEAGTKQSTIGGLIEFERLSEGGFRAHCVLYMDANPGVLGPIPNIEFWLDDQGRWDGRCACPDIPEMDDPTIHGNINSFIATALVTLTFMNCKNVVVADAHGTYANRQERRAAERRGDPPLVTYKTLQIEPMKKVLATEGDIEHNGLAKALHICRGHFAEYGPDYGKGKLFGKYEGRFYVPAHVRGNAENGVVHKRYNVKAPKEDAA